MSKLKVAALQGLSASSDAITLANDGTCTANITNRSNRNLIINGAMMVAQRGTSVAHSGYKTVDRMNFGGSWPGSAITQSQSDVTSGTTPYTLGFRKAYKIVNSSQSSAGAADYIVMTYKTEAQDLATSGWNYKSASSYITVSFWVKSSVAQNFYVRFQTKDGGATWNYPFETGSLTANTWTKVTHSIPGNSNLTIDNDNGEGPKIQWAMYRGSNDTSSSVTLNQWAAYSDGTKTPDYTAAMDDWFLTNGATFEITGLQLEVGSIATDFEHRSYAQELQLCRRYYHAILGKMGSWGSAVAYSTQNAQGWYSINPEMRAAPTFSWTGTLKLEDGASGKTTSNTTASTTMGPHGFSWWTGGFTGLTDNYVYYVYESGQTGYFQLDAEF